MSKYKVLVQLTGSIAAYKTCELISLLVKSGAEVRVCASPNALRFVGEATLEGLSGFPVYFDLWQSGRMMDHISLNRWADLIVVAPATAAYINHVVGGSGDEGLLSALFLAHDFKKPFLIAPAMNQAMYLHPVTQKSINKLKEIGLEILSPGEGSLACGEFGLGRMMEPEEIFQIIQRKISPPSPKGISSRKVLVTSGGTTEAIDDVRVIGNRSTGRTGAQLADVFISAGWDVTYLGAQNSIKPLKPCRVLCFESFLDLSRLLKNELSTHYDIIFHCAAVSDYSPGCQPGKISSETDQWELRLQRHPKLVNFFKQWSVNTCVKIVAFKLTSLTTSLENPCLENAQKVKAAVERIFKESSADFVVHNDFKQLSTQDGHEFNIYSKQGLLRTVKGTKELAQRLVEMVE